MYNIKKKFLSLGLVTIIIFVIFFSNYSFNKMNWSGPNSITANNSNLDSELSFNRIIRANSDNDNSLYFGIASIKHYKMYYYGYLDNYMFAVSNNLIEWNFTGLEEYFGSYIYGFTGIDFTVLNNNSIFLLYQTISGDVGYSLSHDNGNTWSDLQSLDFDTDENWFFSFPFEYNNNIYLVRSLCKGVVNSSTFTQKISRINLTTKQLENITSFELPLSNIKYIFVDNSLISLMNVESSENNINEDLVLVYDLLTNTSMQYNADLISDDVERFKLYENKEELNVVYSSNQRLFNSIIDKENNKWTLKNKEQISLVDVESYSFTTVLPVENSAKKMILVYYNSNYNVFINEFNYISFFYYFTISVILLTIVALPEGSISKFNKKLIKEE